MKKILLSAVLFTALTHPLMADPMDYKNTESLKAQTGMVALELGNSITQDNQRRYGSAMTQDVEMTVAANNMPQTSVINTQDQAVVKPRAIGTQTMESAQEFAQTSAHQLGAINPAAGQTEMVNKETIVIGNTDTGVDMDAIRTNIKQRVVID